MIWNRTFCKIVFSLCYSDILNCVISKSEHGLSIHKGKKHTDINEPSEPNTPAQKPTKTTQPQINNDNFGKFICPTCGLRCKDETFFKYHVSLKHEKVHPGEPTKINECEFCQKELPNKEELENHMKHHKVWRRDIKKTPSPKYECDHCD